MQAQLNRVIVLTDNRPPHINRNAAQFLYNGSLYLFRPERYIADPIHEIMYSEGFHYILHPKAYGQPLMLHNGDLLHRLSMGTCVGDGL